MEKISDIIQRVEAIRAKAQSAKAFLPQASTAPAQLPLWPEPVRAVPNAFLRSALFGVVAHGRRRYLHDEPIAAIDGLEIRYTGQRLDQGDLDVWENVLHIARIQALGSRCRFTSYALLKLIGLTDTGKNRASLHKRLIRLKATAVEVRQGRYSYVGSLIDDIYRDSQTHEYVLLLNPALSALFAPDQYTQIDWAIRRELDGQQLAQWLHGIYASHAEPFPMRMETLLKLSGSENGNPRSAQQKLRAALDAVAEASKAHGQSFKYEIRDGLVYVEKRPSGPQRRHLARKSGKPRKPRG